MVRFLFFFLLIFITQHVWSQDSLKRESDKTNHYPAPFNPGGNYNTLALKFKLLPWVMGNNGGLNGGIGIEQSFFKRNSAGLEFCFNRWAEHYDNDSGYSDDAYHRDRALVANYRFYYGNMNQKRAVCFYNGIAYRYGRFKQEWSDALAENHHTLRIKNYNAPGLIFGMFFGFKNTTNFGIDLNIGGYYNMKTIHDTYTLPPGTIVVNSTTATWDFRISFNFSLWFSQG